ncbi:FliH/SctL family protein [Nitrospina gracilis]|uniref:FliH/SctL family protein n=1 Tax=Nitrospina gracilis TaxID=35801 RepID=UPI001F2AF84F|nr:FliH/SctL family protein [Nitrospina gracilis]MCF8721525.1 flagellar biosynthesis/type III secretory pathway protein FliH [Nitrospina gracilis Nb-211]
MSDSFKPFRSKEDVEGSGKDSDASVSTGGAPFQFQDFGVRRDLPRGFKFDLEKSRNFDEHNIEKARQGVQEVFADAIERIKTKAEEVKAQAREEGHKAGYEEGYKAGEEAARKEFTPFLQTLTEGVEELAKFRSAMYAKLEREMVNMVVGLTKKVIETDLASREDSVRDIIRLAVGSILDRETLVIKVNPRDREHAEHYSPELHRLFPDIRNVRIEGHASVPRGGCRVESNFGSVEADIDRLKAEIDKLMHRAPPNPEELLGYPEPSIQPEEPVQDKPETGDPNQVQPSAGGEEEGPQREDASDSDANTEDEDKAGPTDGS